MYFCIYSYSSLSKDGNREFKKGSEIMKRILLIKCKAKDLSAEIKKVADKSQLLTHN